LLEALWEFHAQNACDSSCPGSAFRISFIIRRLRDGFLFGCLLFALWDSQLFFRVVTAIDKSLSLLDLGLFRRFGIACFLEALGLDGGVLVSGFVLPSFRSWGRLQLHLHDGGVMSCTKELAAFFSRRSEAVGV